MLRWETFAPLQLPGLRHAFSLRSPVPDSELARLLRPSIQTLGWNERAVIEAEEPHGNGVAVVDSGDNGEVMLGVDALVTFTAGMVLAIRVADCGPVYIYDPVKRAIAIAHSGRKGTELNVVGATVATLKASGSRPSDLIAFLGPCIRPPHYEVDFAAEVGRQAAQAGIGTFYDSGLNTAADLSRYYSYRAEKGKTGRMWAVAMLEEGHA